MMPLAALLLLASAGAGLLADHTFTIRPGEWRFIDVSARDHPSLLQAEFAAIEGGGELRLILIPGRDLEAFRRHQEVPLTDSTEWDRSGRLVHHFDGAGSWAVILEHQRDARNAASVRMLVRLDPDAKVRELPQRTRVIVILAGVLFAFAVLIYAARHLKFR